MTNLWLSTSRLTPACGFDDIRQIEAAKFQALYAPLFKRRKR